MQATCAIGRLLRDEDGATTTNWTLLSAGVIGLAAAVLTIVAAGMEDAGSGIATTLEEQAGQGAEAVALDFDFSGGFADWTAAIEAHADPLIADALGPFFDQSGQEVLTRSFSFPPGTDYAVFEFDLAAIGRMEGHDDFRVFVDGEMIDRTSIRDGRIDGVEVNDHGNSRVAYEFAGHRRVNDAAAIDRRMETAAATEANGATTGRRPIASNVDRERTYRVQVVVQDPGENMTLGFGRGGRSPYPGEAWAIDDMTVRAAEGAPDAPGS